MSSWHSYPKVFGMGHPEIARLFDDPVLVEEKVDGSQFSFGLIDGEFKCRSKGKELVLDCVEKMFEPAVRTAMNLAPILTPGWTYRAEYLQKPHHNGLAYDRIPKDHLILFDVNVAEESYLSRAEKEKEAARIGLEIVPVVFEGRVLSHEDLTVQMERVSILGGCQVEGLVFKNYARFGADKKALMGKHVRADFREIQGKQWRINNPKPGDIIEQLGEAVKTPARWEKAIQHLRERGELTESCKDIGNLVKEVQRDVDDEFAAQAKEILWAHAKKQILRMSVGGLPDWYKERLLKQQFSKTAETVPAVLDPMQESLPLPSVLPRNPEEA